MKRMWSQHGNDEVGRFDSLNEVVQSVLIVSHDECVWLTSKPVELRRNDLSAAQLGVWYWHGLAIFDDLLKALL